ncbi:MAG: hypothetical protein QF357_05070 [Dehalococcoidia bacterium]|jgi:spermidine synthase|nr:hypothetical protein [Dehalococcoidia bacterium]
MRYLGIGAVSAAVLLFELTLTRVYSVAQGYHFAFLAVSLGLLGFGASGTILFAGREYLLRRTRILLPLSAFLFTLAALGAYWAMNTIPFDSYRLIVDREMIGWMTAFYVVQIVPFFFAGLVLGGALVADPARVDRIYGSSLVGAGAGSLFALGGPSSTGPNGALLAVAVLGAFALVMLIYRRTTANIAVAGAGVAVLVVSGVLVPLAVTLDVSPYKALPQLLLQEGVQLEVTKRNAFSRIDVVESGSLHQAPGLSFSYAGAIPPQRAVTVDADNATTISRSTKEEAEFSAYLPVAAAFEIVSAPDVLVVEPGGGLDILTALHHGARSITALSGNPIVADLLRDQFRPEIDAGILEVLAGNPRSYLDRSDRKFDLVIVSLADSFRPVRAGAFSLSENHVYTSDAFSAYFDHMSPDGLLAATRWVQVPPSEEMRMVATVVEVLSDRPDVSAERAIAALRTLQTLTVFARTEEFEGRDLDALRTFARTRQMDLSYLPGISPNELNQYFVLPVEIYFRGITELLDEARRDDFYAGTQFNVKPLGDDRPFFFHFFRWRQLPDAVDQIGKTFDPFGGAGFLVVLLFLGVSIVVSCVLILLPLAFVKTTPAAHPDGRGRVLHPASLGYFFMLGLAFLWIELPLMQRFILLLDYPTYSFGIVLFAVLVFSGLGSILSGRLGRLRNWSPLVLAFLAVVYGLGFLPPMDLVLGLPLAARVVVAVVSIAPIGLLMGIPFPAGIRAVEVAGHGLVPWLWGVNGYASVMGSILAALIALEGGYSAVMLAAAAAYAIAWALLRLGIRPGVTARERTARTAPLPGSTTPTGHHAAR